MKASDVKKLFLGIITSESFRELIAAEVSAYDKLHEKLGASIPIVFEDDEELLIGMDEMMFLCNAYLSGDLGSADISYMADAFTLSEKVEYASELIRYEIEELCWFQTNKSWSEGDVRAMITRLKA